MIFDLPRAYFQVPWQQLMHTVTGMVSDRTQHPSQDKSLDQHRLVLPY